MNSYGTLWNHHDQLLLGVRNSIWGFPLMEVPQNGLFIRENPIEMDELRVPPFMETPIYII